MKRFFLLITISPLLLLPAAYSQQTTQRRPLTLAQCYQEARDNYPLIKQYGLIEQAEQYNVSNAGKGWLPQLAFNARATYQSEVTKLPLDLDKLAAMIPGFSIPVQNKDQYQLLAEVNQTLWDGGLIASAKELSHAQAETERKQLESNLYALNERVNQLFFGCLLQDELLKQNEIMQEEWALNIERIVSMMDNGVANSSDKESLEAELLNTRRQAIELKAARKAWSAMLGALIGRPLDEALPLAMPPLPGSRRSLQEINRPELQALDAQSRLVGAQNKQIDAALMPRIGFFVQGGYGRPGLNMLKDSFEPFYMAGIRLTWNIGKFYTLSNDRRKVENAQRLVEVQRETFLFNTTLQLLQQNTEIQKMNELLTTDNHIVSLRTGIREAAEVKLANGVIAVSDLIREIHAEDLAKQTVATHRLQHLMAIYNYIYTTN